MSSTRPARRPHILVVLTDDQGPWALGRHSPELATPTLDRLAAEGTCLERFFCASPVCSPARASLLTGRLPSAHGVHDWLVPEALDESQGEYLQGATTFPETLSAAGYRTGMVGKWHVGSSRGPAPGFDYWYPHRFGGGPYYGAPIWEFDEAAGVPAADAREMEEPRYLTDAIGEQASDFLRRHDRAGDDRPFYLQLTPTAPHSPWTDGNHPVDLVSLYDDTDFPSVPVPEEPHPWSRPGDVPATAEQRHAMLAGYAAAVTGVDRMLSGVIGTLEELGLLEDTIIVFTSDNGFSCGHHGIWGKGNGTEILNFWENSIRVPFIAWGPGRIAAGQVRNDLVSATSFLETILDLAGVEAPEDPLRAGSSVAHLLRSDAGPGADGGPGADRGPGTDGGPGADGEIFVLDEYGDNRMIRTERWKLVLRRRGPGELFDLEADPAEEDDLFEDPASAAVRRDLEDRLDERFRALARPQTDGWELDVSGHGQLGRVDGPGRSLHGAELFQPGASGHASRRRPAVAG